MIAKFKDSTVHFTVKVTKLNKDTFGGTVIETSNNVLYPLGYYGTTWSRNEFIFTDNSIVETSETYIKDSIVENVINQFKQRSEVGIKKYNTTLDRTDLSTLDWIEHAKQEAMDFILYLEKLKSEVNNLKNSL
jgi:hypothetical protein